MRSPLYLAVWRRDLAQIAGLSEEQITLIYNPVDAEAIAHAGKMPTEHPWLTDHSCPIVLGVGRLHRQKDFPTLIRAFASRGKSVI